LGVGACTSKAQILITPALSASEDARESAPLVCVRSGFRPLAVKKNSQRQFVHSSSTLLPQFFHRQVPGGD
jgi:hypothetical protein